MTGSTPLVRLGRRFMLGIGAAGVLLLGACSSSRTVSGKVLAGEAGVVTVVQANDPRLEESGLAGVEVRITDGSAGMGSLASTTSEADGSFSLKLSEQAMIRRLEIHASAADILPFHGTAMLPMDDRKLLLIVEPVRTMGSVERGR